MIFSAFSGSQKCIPMKKQVSTALIIAFAVIAHLSYAQTAGDTVKLKNPNDAMVINPGKANDSMAVKPPKPNDGMVVMTDTGFISKAIQDNRVEIELATLGEIKHLLHW